MNHSNNGIGESNILQNQFTAYLTTAVRRRKIQYMQAKMKQQKYEIYLENQEQRREFQYIQDMTLCFPLLERLESGQLRCAIERLKEREIHILTMKVLGERSFQEIADETGLGYKTISSIYYRLIRKLRDELGGEKNEL